MFFYGEIIGSGLFRPCFTSGWWSQPTPLKNDGVKVSWDDEIPNLLWKVIKNVPNHQPDFVSMFYPQLLFVSVCSPSFQEPSFEVPVSKRHPSLQWHLDRLERWDGGFHIGNPQLVGKNVMENPQLKT